MPFTPNPMVTPAVLGGANAARNAEAAKRGAEEDATEARRRQLERLGALPAPTASAARVKALRADLKR